MQPPQPAQQEDSWAVVAGRKKKAAENKAAAKTTPPKKGGVGKKVEPPQGNTSQKKRKSPLNAAVTITCPKGKYEKTLREAKSKIDLASLKIDGLRPKRAVTGAIIYEVIGEGGAEKADKLAAKLREAFAGKEEVRVARPIKMTEMRVSGLGTYYGTFHDSDRKREIPTGEFPTVIPLMRLCYYGFQAESAFRAFL